RMASAMGHHGRGVIGKMAAPHAAALSDTLPLMGSEKIAWVFAALAAILVAAAAAPLIRTGWWPVRIPDFPRMQIAVIAAAIAATLLAFCLIWGWSPVRLGALAALGVVV